MSQTVHEILLQSNQHFGKRLPPHHLGFFLAEIPVAVRQAVSMAVRHRSSTPGRHPSWLDRASDIRFVGHSGNGQTVLYFEVPTLGDSAYEIYQQTELWPSRPSDRDTGFDLLGDVLGDMAAGDSDSEHIDSTLLHRLLRFKRVFAGPFTEIDITSRRFQGSSPARMTPDTLQMAQGMLAHTPRPTRVRIVGTLDMLRASTQSFAVRLDTGDEVRGILLDGSFDDAKQLLNRRVLILGKAVYRASGRLLRIDADSLAQGDAEAAIWSRMPQPSSKKFDVSSLRKAQGPRSGMAAIMGRWPGDESDEEITAALERLS